jgi:alpha-ribazole phosphatase
MEIVLIRHTRPAVDEGVCYGASDLGVCADFETQAQAVRLRLGDIAGAALSSSPLARCRKLAEALGTPRYDERLKELDFGEWELLPWSRIGRAAVDRWRADVDGFAPPGGESYAALHRRASAFLDEACAEGFERLLVVTHGGVIRALLARMLGIPLMESLALRVDFGSLTRVALRDGKFELQALNC